jgi:hypothetical protein
MSSTSIDGHFYLRAAILSFRTHKEEVDLALRTLDQEVHALLTRATELATQKDA